MSLTFYLRRALQLPPHETARRGWRILAANVKGRWQRWQERRVPSYVAADGPSGLTLKSYFRPLRLDILRPHRERIALLADFALAHRFDLLGSGRVEVRHGMTCAGFEGHRYPSGPVVQTDAQGQWLRGRINPPNFPRATEIWQLVRPEYIPIDWSLDFISGHRWAESCYHLDITDSVRPGVDIKVPWELARMQHLPQLAWAFALAQAGEPGLQGADVYLREYQDQVLDFLATNPPRYGVNWKCTMDVAIRAANWLFTYDLFRAQGADFSGGFEKAFLRGIYEHGLHIVNNLEWSPTLRANHYLADLAGLLFVAAYLSGKTEIEHWLAFAIGELIQEVTLQFSPDGSSFEASTSYHRLSAEMTVYATALGLALPEQRLRTLATLSPPAYRPGPAPPLALYEHPTGGLVPFPADHFRRMERMVAFSYAIALPGGHVPQIGDNDSGRFLKVWPALIDGPAGVPAEDLLDHRHLMAAFNGFCQRQDYARFAGDSAIETEIVRCLAGADRITALGHLPMSPDSDAGAREGPNPVAFRDFGLAIFRTARLIVVVRCGPVGQKGNGGHAHNDQLSFELHFDGMPVVVDPGTYVYTPSQMERNCFRSTMSHNTLTIDGLEQDPWTGGRLGLFSLNERSRAQILEVSANSFIGEHVGYGLPHRRGLQVSDEQLLAQDECAVQGPKRLRFHLDPRVQILMHGGEAEVLLGVGGQRLRLGADGGKWSVAPGWYSAGYGIRVATRVCELRFEGEAVRWHIGPADYNLISPGPE